MTLQTRWIWMDGNMVEWEKANIHVLSHGLHYGSAVFEGERAYNGKIFKATEHHQRLHDSAEMIGLKIPYNVQELNDAAYNVLSQNNLVDAYIRPIAWSGSESLGLGSYKNSVHVAIAAWSWDSYFEADKGIKLMWSEWTRPSPEMAPVHAKASGLYIISSLSKNKAEYLGFHDALMLDYRGFVAECTGANIFMFKDGRLFTPHADCFLNGITRQTIIEIAAQEGIECHQVFITKEELLAADEVFVTGSAAEVTPVSLIAEVAFPVGESTKRMMQLYKEYVGKKN